MNSVSEKIIEKIKSEHLAPEPKWKFLLKNEIFWGAFGISIVLGGLAWSVILDMLIENEWEIYEYSRKSLLEYVLLTLPYLWIVCLVIFFALAIYNYRHTRNAYRRKPVMILSASFLASVFLGLIFYFCGWGRATDTILESNVNYYPLMMRSRTGVWHHPEIGLLSGIVSEIKNPNEFNLRDMDGQSWQVVGEEIRWRGIVTPQPEIQVRVVGEQIGVKVFHGREVHTGRGGRRMQLRRLPASPDRVETEEREIENKERHESSEDNQEGDTSEESEESAEKLNDEDD